MTGGFGNLTGDMVFWDPRKLKEIGWATAHCAAVRAWSPNSRFLLAAVLSPRVRVDNGFKLFTYAGELVGEREYGELLDAAWQPAPPGTYDAPPLSPRVYSRAQARAAAMAKGVNPGVAKGGPATKTAYVPPALRAKMAAQGASSSGSVSSAVREALRGNLQGAEKVQRATRTASELARQAEAGGPVGSGGGGPVGGGTAQLSKSEQREAKQIAALEKKRAAAAAREKREAAAAAKKAAEPAFEIEEFDAAAAMKKMKALERNLGKIEQLKEQLADGGQLSKKLQALVDSEAELRDELEKLNKQCEEAY